jgi:hypothetical protein
LQRRQQLRVQHLAARIIADACILCVKTTNQVLAVLPLNGKE